MQMRFTKTAMLAVYLPITAGILVLDWLLPNSDVVVCLKFGTMISLFLFAVLTRKKTTEQKIMAAAYYFLVIGDFFLVCSEALHFKAANTAMFGGAAFFCAYLCLIAAYHKNFSPSLKEAAVAAPMITALIVVVVFLKPFISGAILTGVVIFGVCLCFMTWSAVCTLFRGYYSKQTARLIAVSACLMLLCDIGVGLCHFYPHPTDGIYPWLKAVVWAAYVPGWTLLIIVIREKERSCVLYSAHI